MKAREAAIRREMYKMKRVIDSILSQAEERDCISLRAICSIIHEYGFDIQQKTYPVRYWQVVSRELSDPSDGKQSKEA